MVKTTNEKKRLEAGMVLTPTSLVVKGKPHEVMAIMNSMVKTHGDATLPEAYANTMAALKHPASEE